MIWRRKIHYCTITFAWGCYIFDISRNTVVSKCEHKCPETKSENASTFMDLPEISGELFIGDTDSLNWFPVLHTKSPIYWKLFMLTKSKKRSVRHKAIKLLSESTKLKRWEYMMIAQACGPSTSVGLARSAQIHQPFFFLPPFRGHTLENLNEEMINLIEMLSQKDVNVTSQNLIVRVKKIYKRIIKNNINEEPENFIEIFHSERNKKDIFDFDKLCLQIILCHSTAQSHRQFLVENGVLRILWEILNRHESNKEFQCLIAQILANFSLEEEFCPTLYTTGWIGVLASWSKSPFLSVSLPAAKALANLDTDDTNHSLYDHNIYLLHPLLRSSEKELFADMIFIHGLFGSTFWTWRQCDAMKILVNDNKNLNVIENLEPEMNSNVEPYTFCWPKDWIPLDHPNLRILSIDYNTDVRTWRSLLSKQNENLVYKANILINKLMKANVGDKPIIWVTHSMGGILVKQILIAASESNETRINQIAKNTVGIIFFSVPHKGSEFISLLQSVPYVLPASEISQFHKGSSTLLSLQDKFTELVQQNNIAILSFGETKKSKWGLNLVSVDSSNPGVGEFHPLPVDHLSTCKPESRSSKVYKKINEFIKNLVPFSRKSATNPVYEICNIMCLIP